VKAEVSRSLDARRGGFGSSCWASCGVADSGARHLHGCNRGNQTKRRRVGRLAVQPTDRCCGAGRLGEPWRRCPGICWLPGSSRPRARRRPEVASQAAAGFASRWQRARTTPGFAQGGLPRRGRRRGIARRRRRPMVTVFTAERSRGGVISGMSPLAPGAVVRLLVRTTSTASAKGLP
jgi:hypothetical protein